MMAIGYERSLGRLRAAIDRLDDPQLEETEDAPVRA
jgi:hypothetical protein